MIERDLSEPDRIVGELLQPGGYLKLVDLGLEGKRESQETQKQSQKMSFPTLYFVLLSANCVKGIDAQKVFGYALYKDGKHTQLSYPLEHFHPDVAGRGFHYGRFIQSLRAKTASLSNYSFLFPSKDFHFTLAQVTAWLLDSTSLFL